MLNPTLAFHDSLISVFYIMVFVPTSPYLVMCLSGFVGKQSYQHSNMYRERAAVITVLGAVYVVIGSIVNIIWWLFGGDFRLSFFVAQYPSLANYWIASFLMSLSSGLLYVISEIEQDEHSNTIATYEIVATRTLEEETVAKL